MLLYGTVYLYWPTLINYIQLYVQQKYINKFELILYYLPAKHDFPSVPTFTSQSAPANPPLGKNTKLIVILAGWPRIDVLSFPITSKAKASFL